jgi:hypothetical protein
VVGWLLILLLKADGWKAKKIEEATTKHIMVTASTIPCLFVIPSKVELTLPYNIFSITR